MSDSLNLPVMVIFWWQQNKHFYRSGTYLQYFGFWWVEESKKVLVFHMRLFPLWLSLQHNRLGEMASTHIWLLLCLSQKRFNHPRFQPRLSFETLHTFDEHILTFMKGDLKTKKPTRKMEIKLGWSFLSHELIEQTFPKHPDILAASFFFLQNKTLPASSESELISLFNICSSSYKLKYVL